MGGSYSDVLKVLYNSGYLYYKVKMLAVSSVDTIARTPLL